MSILTPEQKAIQQATKEFVAEYIIPQADKYDKSAEFHPEIVAAAKDSKIFALSIPKEYGGLGYDFLTQSLVYEEWAYGCAGMGTTIAVNALALNPVTLFGTDAQKKHFFAPIFDGELASFGLTEPGAGSDVGSNKTSAVKVGNEYILNGTKCWITNGGYAKRYTIFAKTDPNGGTRGLSAFLVDRDFPGFSIGTVDHKLGISSSNTVELLLRDVHVPAANLLGKEGDGMKIAMKSLDLARPAVAALSVGIAQRALDECVKHVQKRFPGKPPAGQALQFKLADMQIQVEAARSCLHEAMRMRDAGVPFESAICKTFCSDVAMQVTSTAVSLMGSYGYIKLGKFMRDAKIMQVYEGTNQIQRLVIARGVLAPAPAPTAQKAGK
jgi:alkylation response protein AidB-like acyl-CoA dehydrogenase